MIRKGLILILLLSTLLSLTSCGLDYRYSLDESNHNQIEVVLEEDQPSHIIYQDNNYVFAGTTNLFSVDTYKTDDGYYLSYKDDILLSWNGSRYFWYIDEYYSYTSDNPIFIYNERLGDVYFREDYDHLKDTFVIEGTTSEIVWEDMLGSKQPHFEFSDPIKVVIYSKQCPRIDTCLELVFLKNEWYLSFSDSQTLWSVSDEFIKILSENEIITQ